MNYDPDIHNRRYIRLKNYDYSKAGVYFVTIYTHKKEMILGDIKNGVIHFNEFGKIVEFTWNDLVNHNNHISLDRITIMPNHLHGIITLKDNDFNIVGAGSESAPTNSITRHGLSEIIMKGLFEMKLSLIESENSLLKIQAVRTSLK